MIELNIQDYYAGDYRLEYDGKYLSLLGRDKNYPQFKFNPNDIDTYEEMLLMPAFLEGRNLQPSIVEVTNTKIIIKLKNN